LEPTKLVRIPEELEKLRQKIESEQGNKKPTVSICISTGCVALGATSVLEAFKTGIQKAKLTEKRRNIE